jgi:general secretion pathway protein G
VELLVVVVAGVALILVGIGLARWSKAQSMMSTASTQLLLLSNALDHYADENGGYPHVADYSGLIVYVALFGDGVGSDGRAATEDDTELDGTPDKSATVYLKELDPMGNPLKMVEHSEQGIPARLVDPWGNPWRYRSGSHENHNGTFDLWSVGPDGRDGTSDDVRNW